ncbi:MAG: cytochrome C [Campylobacter sp.]|nr:cytochrome C [Campylobacter sp.]
MKTGKILAIVIGALCIGAVVYIMNSGAPDPTKTASQTAKQESNYKDNEAKEAARKKEQMEAIEKKEQEKIAKLEEERAALERKRQNEGVSALYRISCAPCHGLDGRGEIAPHIAGQTEEQILKSLQDFKTHSIDNTLMSELLQNVSDENLSILAEEISRFE